MIALEVSSAAGGGYGGVPGAVRNLVGALVRGDPSTHFDLCYRLSRWRKGRLFRVAAPNARLRVVQDPFNRWLLRGDRLLHSMGIFLPATPRIPRLVTVHDLNAVRNREWVSERWHERRSARIREVIGRADHVVTYSAFTAREVYEEYGLAPERVHPIPLGVDAQAFRPPPPEVVERTRRRHGDYVLSIGIANPRKNFVALIAALAPLKDLRFVLVGRGGDGALQVRQAIERCEMQGRFEQLEGVAHEELVALLGSARVYAVPSLYEGFGLTVLEAMACGTPVVCSRAASLPEVAGNAARLVDATDIEALREAIRRVASDAELAAELRTRGLERARELSWEAAARRLRSLYRAVAGV